VTSDCRGLRHDSSDARTLRATCVMTSIVAADVFSVSLAFDRPPSGLADSDDALRPGSLASSLRRRHAFACVSTFVARDRPAAPNQSVGMGTTGILVTTGPATPSGASGASLEVSRPLQHTSAASRARSEGGRPPDLSRSGVLRSPDRPRSRATDLHDRRTRRPCGFPLFQRVMAASLDPVDALQPSPAAPHLAASLARDAIKRTEPCQLELRRLRPVARVRSVKPTRLILIPHARGGPAVRAALCATPPRDLAARAGHAPTRPLRAAFRYPHPGAVARPCRTSGPSLFARASSGGAPGVRSLRRFNPVYGWSRGAGTAAKYRLATFPSDRAHVPFMPGLPRPDLFSSG